MLLERKSLRQAAGPGDLPRAHQPWLIPLPAYCQRLMISS